MTQFNLNQAIFSTQVDGWIERTTSAGGTGPPGPTFATVVGIAFPAASAIDAKCEGQVFAAASGPSLELPVSQIENTGLLGVMLATWKNRGNDPL